MPAAVVADVKIQTTAISITGPSRASGAMSVASNEINSTIQKAAGATPPKTAKIAPMLPCNRRKAMIIAQVSRLAKINDASPPIPHCLIEDHRNVSFPRLRITLTR
jgi:hypothetical protein